MGNGLKHTDTTEVVVVDKALESGLVHVVGLGKGEGLTHEAGHLLSQGAVPTLHVAGLA